MTQGDVCLLARIETSVTAPFGMTFPENASVDTNTRNNIVWKNVTPQDLWPGPLMIASTWQRNVFAGLNSAAEPWSTARTP